MVNLKELERAVAAIEDINRHTLEFEVAGTKLSLRPIRPSEEVEVMARLKEHVDGMIQRDWTAIKKYNVAIKIETLACTIVRMGDLDLSGNFVDTGETLADGTPIQVPKAEALREHLAAKWSSGMIEAVFARYVELILSMMDRTQIKIDGEKVAERVARLQEQIATLQRLNPEVKLGPEDLVQDVLRKQHERRAEKEELAPEVQIPEAPPAEPQPGRAPSYPQEIFDPRDPLQRGRMSKIPEPHEGHSFMDDSDPEAAVAAENARQLEFLRAQQAAKQAQVQQRQRPMQKAPPGVPTFRVPAETLDSRGRAPEPEIEPDSDPNRNPRFRPRTP